MALSEEQMKLAYRRFCGEAFEASGEPYGAKDGLTESRFLDEFRTRYLCTAPVTMTNGLATWREMKGSKGRLEVIKGGKTVRKVDVNEVLEGLEAPNKVGFQWISMELSGFKWLFDGFKWISMDFQ